MQIRISLRVSPFGSVAYTTAGQSEPSRADAPEAKVPSYSQPISTAANKKHINYDVSDGYGVPKSTSST